MEPEPKYCLLKSIGEAMMNCLGDQIVKRGMAVIDALPEIAERAWAAWSEASDEAAQRLELKSLAMMEPSVLRPMVRDIVRKVAGNRSSAVRQILATYLCLVPSQIRQAVRRPSDPLGTTIPSKLAPRNARQFAMFLPIDIPIFEPGDRPLVGVDWVLTELLGVGGFGEVWKARNPHFSCVDPVVLKFYLSKNPGDNKAFLHEAAILNRALPNGSHPGLVELKATYLESDPPCLEYEFIGDGDLAQIVQHWSRKGGVPVLAATRILWRLARIVSDFHSMSPPIVHRDLKPANILLKRCRDHRKQKKVRLKIIDFGIGGLAASKEISRLHDLSSRGFILGTALYGSHTPLYASPEQARGNPPDPTDDIHALGVIWYQMVMGDLTIGAPTGLDWISELFERGLDQEQLAVFASCFASRADRRPANAGVLADRLETILKALSNKTKSSQFQPAVSNVQSQQTHQHQGMGPGRLGFGSKASPSGSNSDSLSKVTPLGTAAIPNLDSVIISSVRKGSLAQASPPSSPPINPIVQPQSSPPPGVAATASSAAAGQSGRWRFGQPNPGGSGSMQSVPASSAIRMPPASAPPAPPPPPPASPTSMLSSTVLPALAAVVGQTAIPFLSKKQGQQGKAKDRDASTDSMVLKSKSSNVASPPGHSGLLDVGVPETSSRLRRDGQGIGITHQFPHEDVAIRLLLSVLKQQAPNRAQLLCQQLEHAVELGFFSKQLIWSLSRFCHSNLSAHDVAQSIVRKLFGVVPPAFLNDRDLPVPDLETAEAIYHEWRDFVCGGKNPYGGD